MKVGDRVVCIKRCGRMNVGEISTVYSTTHYNGSWILVSDNMGWSPPDCFVPESVYNSKLFNILK